jgi:hypothetical protein
MRSKINFKKLNKDSRKYSYSWVHAWVQKNKVKPDFCEQCHKYPPRDLASVREVYIKNVDEFEWLCRRCHIKKDGRLRIWLKRNEGRTKYPVIPEGYCACGCKSKIKLIDKKCRPIIFKKGHNPKRGNIIKLKRRLMIKNGIQ